MTRVSKLVTSEDFAIEARREAFRNSRWSRRCKVFLAISGGVALVHGSGELERLLAVLRTLGI